MNAKKIRLSLLLTAVSAIVVFAGTFLYLHDSPDSSSRHGTRDKLDTFAVGETGAPGEDKILDFLEYKLQPGKAYDHKFRRTMRIAMNGKGMLDMMIEGHISVHAVAARSGGIDTVFEITFEKLQGLEGDPRDSRKQERLKIGDTYLAFLRIDRRGHSRTLRFKKSVPPAARMMFRDIVANFLQPLPASGSRPLKPEKESFLGRFLGGSGDAEYKVTGEDTQGKYLARLGLDTTSATLVRMNQRKVRYILSSAPVRVRASRREGEWDVEKGLLSRVVGADDVVVSGGGVRVESEQAYRYEFRGTRKSAFTSGDLLRFTELTGIYDDRHLKTAQARAANQLPAKTWKELSSMLDALDSKANLQAKHKTFRALSRSMRKNPRLAEPAIARARNYDSSDLRFKMIVGALSYSGAPNAQDGLTEIYRKESMDDSGKQNILSAFTLMEKGLTPRAMKMLVNVFHNAEDPGERNSAGLALGSALKNAENETAYNLILRSWNEADSVDRRAVVLQFMGNSGDPRFLSIIKQMDAGDSEVLRQKAIYATRFMNSEQSNTFLIQYLESKKKPGLKLIAARALSMHSFQLNFLTPLKNCVLRESFVPLRISCADYVLEQRPHESEMKDILAGIRGGKEKLSPEFKDYIEQQLSGRE